MQYLFLIFMLTVSSNLYAAVKIEPLYGVEHTLHRYPPPERYATRTFFGARLLAGSTLLSFELEGNQSNGRRDFPSENLKVEDQVQRLLIGLRSTFPTTQWLGVYFRAGARGTKEKTTIHNSADDTKTVKEPPIYWDPYAGAGLQLAISNILAVNSGATWSFVSGGKPDVQYTLGLTLKFGQIR